MANNQIFENASVQALIWEGDSLKILDQRKLPETMIYEKFHSAAGVADAIKTMRVRGAPAIGIAAAYGVVLSVQQHYQHDASDWQQKVQGDINLLAASRPTAVNLFWALEKMRHCMLSLNDDFVTDLEKLAISIHHDDIAANFKMGEFGADIIGNSKGIMTHCNAGALATGGYGTALGVIRSCFKRGVKQFYAGETRPWLQGARLTVWELAQDQIPATLIADSAAAYLMQQGMIDWIVVGADRIAANGDVANKIGTYSLAVLARQHGVKLMVVAPMSTIDYAIQNGSQINIEQRSAEELLPSSYLSASASEFNQQISAWNPVFDVTPAELISVIVTQRGVVKNPTTIALKSLQDD